MRIVAFLMSWFVLLVTASHAGAGSGPSIAGDWLRNDGASRINIAPCGERLCAVNTWIRDPGEGEGVGDRIVMTLQVLHPAALAGEGFDERRRQHYSLLISVVGDAMTTKGCMLSGTVCKTLRWTRNHSAKREPDR